MLLYCNKTRKIIISFIVILSLFSKNVFADDEDNEEIDENDINEIIASLNENNETQVSVSIDKKINKEPNLNSKSAIIYDRDTKKVLWGKNENDKRAMASTTKIMTAIVVLENSDLTDIVTCSKKAAGTGGSVLKIKEEDKISVNDLLYGLMLRSRK